MFVNYRSPGSAAKWLLGVDKRTTQSQAPSEVVTLKRLLQAECAKKKIEHRSITEGDRTYYKISEPVLKDWFRARYQVEEALNGRR